MTHRLDETPAVSASCSLFLWLVQKQTSAQSGSVETLWSLLRQLVAIGVKDFSLQSLPSDAQPRPSSPRPAPTALPAGDSDDLTTPLSPVDREDAENASDRRGIADRLDRADRMWQVWVAVLSHLVHVSLSGRLLRRLREAAAARGDAETRGERAAIRGVGAAAIRLPRDDAFFPGIHDRFRRAALHGVSPARSEAVRRSVGS